MQAGGAGPVAIEPAAGQLCQPLRSRRKVLRLSPGVYAGRSLAALGIAAHEAGHAIQHASRFPGLIVRSAIVPLANLGSIAFWLLILAGLFLGMFRLIIWGLALFSLGRGPPAHQPTDRTRRQPPGAADTARHRIDDPGGRRRRRPRAERRGLDVCRRGFHERAESRSAAIFPFVCFSDGIVRESALKGQRIWAIGELL